MGTTSQLPPWPELLQQSRFRRVAVAIILTLVALVLYEWLMPFDSYPPGAIRPSSSSGEQFNVPSALHTLWDGIKVPPTAENFTVNRELYTQHTNTWSKPLGKRLCIVDVDNRPMHSANDIWTEKGFHWKDIEKVSAGWLNHYLYAMIHGYDYKWVHSKDIPGRSAYWNKIPVMGDLLHTYDIIVVADGDVVWPHLHLPYEWLLNRWGFKADTAIMMSQEPPGYNNGFGRRNGNAGFITVQNLPETHDMLRKWYYCPDDEEHFPNCARFSENWPAEQGAFGEYIRYQFADHFLQIPCEEAMGWNSEEGDDNNGCKGLFVRHYTINKDSIKKGIEEAVLEGFMKSLHRNVRDREDIVKVERKSWGFEIED